MSFAHFNPATLNLDFQFELWKTEREVLRVRDTRRAKLHLPKGEVNEMLGRIFTEASVAKGESDTSSWLEAYTAHQRYSESPTSFHFWTGVSAIAGALRRKVWIDQRHFQWTPNMYIVLVGPAGVVAKSTSIRPGLEMLREVKGVSFGPQSMTWQALIQSFKKAEKPLTIGTKTEKISCICVGVSELGTFLDPADRILVDFLTDMWDGQKGPWTRFIKGEGEITLESPWINLIACTTPSWLKSNFPEDLVGGGLTSRIVFVYADQKFQLISYPSEEIEEEAYEIEKMALINDLKQIGELQGEYKITKDALEWGDSWYQHYQNGGLPAHLASPRFEGYVARKQTHVHKLAMVLAASKRNDLFITINDLKEAEAHISALETDMMQVFSSIGVSQQAKVTSEVITIIKNHPSGIAWQDLWKLCIRTMKQQDFMESLKGAVDANQVKKVPIPGFVNAEGKPNNYMLTYTGGRR